MYLNIGDIWDKSYNVTAHFWQNPTYVNIAIM